MPSNPAHYGLFTFIDYSEENSSMKFYNGPITALTIAAYLTQYGALRDAVEDISLGVLVADQWIGDNTHYANAAPTDVNAQRERKWLVSYEGTTSHSKYTMTIPCANFEDQLLPDSDEADLTTTEMAAFITAFETVARTPEGEAVNVLDITGVGRNN